MSLRRNDHRYRPTFEGLEPRYAPARVVQTLDLDGLPGVDTLRVIGDGLNQRLFIRDFAPNVQVQLDCNGDLDFTDPGDVNQVFNGNFKTFDLQMQAGNDQVTFNMVNGYFGASRKLSVFLGLGNDRFRFTNGVSNNEDITNSSLTLDIRGEAGNDVIRVDFLSGLFDQAQISGSTVAVNVSGSTGFDVVQTRLGAGVTAADLTFNASLGDNDDVFNHTFLGFSPAGITATGAVHFKVNGDLGDDILRVLNRGMAQVDGLLELNLNGGAGGDTTIADFVGSGLTAPINGTLKLRTDGGLGNDVTRLRLNTGTSVGELDLTMLGGDGNDILSIFLQTDTNNFGELEFVLLDGGLGTDRAVITGSGAFNVVDFRCEL